MGSRTRARECALQALYQLDTTGGDPRQAVRGVLAHGIRAAVACWAAAVWE